MTRTLTGFLPSEPPPENALSFVAYVTDSKEIAAPVWTTQGPSRPHLVCSVMRVTPESDTAAVRRDMARLLRLWADRLDPQSTETYPTSGRQ